ncbi:MAG TPA: 4-(cytidine 5'-diphospho)-2-C-methyl-D-erythritol kinase [Xanthobacteraceae bacterium]|nr:4-(cytidine 5'-diphospho)-2-C-methyl-D-erythritol kinase [Xanthobacteraceae bacterium]
MAARRTTVTPLAAAALIESAFAKINLTLRIVGRRGDGYHDLESLVCFASLADRLELRVDAPLELRVSGPMAVHAGALEDNLVLRAARALDLRVKDLRLGRFVLIKRLPVGAGLGGGSSDAAAALRLLARANGLTLDDERVREAARETGADVPVCLDPRARWMRGTGDILSEPVAVPRMFALLVHPSLPLATRDVFTELAAPPRPEPGDGDVPPVPAARKDFAAFLAGHGNDLEAPAIRLAPIIDDVLMLLREQPGCVLARMSGSGSTCFGVFATRSASVIAARAIADLHPAWWVRTTELGASLG